MPYSIAGSRPILPDSLPIADTGYWPFPTPRDCPMTSPVILQTSIPGWPVRRGKVRDIYDLGDRLLLVSTDRISAFDWVLPSGIPDKGRVLTQLSNFWFQRLGEPHHLLSTTVDDLELPTGCDRRDLAGRSILVRKTTVVPIECVVRGYLAGSGWGEYQKTGSVCGIKLPAGLRESERLAEPIFTPATKEESGHDINISFAEMTQRAGSDLAEELRTPQHRRLPTRGRARALARNRHRGHQVRMGPRGGRVDFDRRGAYAGQFAFLARRSICARGRTTSRSTSSSCGTGYRRPLGTRTPSRQHCQPM